jgi:enamine deaminase RidA (YjgF/YER057c/UK114 family)
MRAAPRPQALDRRALQHGSGRYCRPAAWGVNRISARQDVKVLMPSDAASLKIWEDWGFSDAIVTGDTIYLSGVVAGVREGETDLRLGYTRAFERIGEILKNAGATWDDVVEITSFHTDLTTQMPAMVAVKKNYVKPPFPAWTAIQVSRLIPTNGITEIKIVAKLRK